MDYWIALVVTALLFLRPSEILPSLADWPLFQYAMLVGLAVSAGPILSQIAPPQLGKSPITACVIGFALAAPFSHLSKFDFWSARSSAVELLRILVFYLLIVSALYTRARFVGYLRWLTICITAMAALALAHEHGVLRIPSLEGLSQYEGVDSDTGETVTLCRLRGAGFFHDPNDFAMILVGGATLRAL